MNLGEKVESSCLWVGPISPLLYIESTHCITFVIAITTEPRQVCLNTAGDHTPSNFTTISIDHQTSPFYPSYFGAAAGGISAPPTDSFRRPNNLRDFLVRATLTAKTYESPGNRPCGAAQCKTCPILMTTDEFTSHKTGQVFKMKSAASCKSSNIVYLISCRRCGHQ